MSTAKAPGPLVVGHVIPATGVAPSVPYAPSPTPVLHGLQPLPGWPPVASTPPADFWDRVAREVARLLVERQTGAALGPATSSTLGRG